MIGAALFTLLTSPPALRQQLESRVYPLRLPPEPQLPAVAYQLIGETRARGPRRNPGLVSSRVQLSVVGRHYDEAHQLASLIRQQLSRYRGMVAGLDIRDMQETDSHDQDDGQAPHLLAMSWRIDWKQP